MTRSDVIDSAIRTFRPKTPIQVETSFLISSHRPVNGYPDNAVIHEIGNTSPTLGNLKASTVDNVIQSEQPIV